MNIILFTTVPFLKSCSSRGQIHIPINASQFHSALWTSKETAEKDQEMVRVPAACNTTTNEIRMYSERCIPSWYHAMYFVQIKHLTPQRRGRAFAPETSWNRTSAGSLANFQQVQGIQCTGLSKIKGDTVGKSWRLWWDEILEDWKSAKRKFDTNLT